MLYFLTETTTEEKINTCTYQHYPLCHWRSQTIQASRHIIINTEQSDRKILNGEGSQGHWHLCYNSECFSHFHKVMPLQQKRCIKLLYLATQLSIKPCNEFFHDRKDYINDSLFHQKGSATNRLSVVSRASYAQGSLAYTTKGHNHCKTLHKYCVPCAS